MLYFVCSRRDIPHIPYAFPLVPTTKEMTNGVALRFELYGYTVFHTFVKASRDYDGMKKARDQVACITDRIVQYVNDVVERDAGASRIINLYDYYEENPKEELP